MPSKQSGSNSSSTSEMRLCAIGSHGIRIGQDSANAKYLDSEVEMVFMLREAGLSYQAISERLDMPRSTVHAIATGVFRGLTPTKYEKRLCKKR